MMTLKNKLQKGRKNLQTSHNLHLLCQWQQINNTKIPWYSHYVCLQCSKAIGSLLLITFLEQ
jgi:hypothetical protein